VYLGRWREGEVAIKRLINILTEKQLMEFKAEANLLAGLRPHSNVVQFLGITTQPDKPLCIITEYLASGSLSHFLQGPRAKELEAADKMIELSRGCAAGILHLHTEGIIHRDIAARNILLTSSLSPKVSDFGMSRVMGDQADAHKTQSAVGPIRWMAPEALCDGEYSQKTDSYAFGCLLYEIMTRKVPFVELDLAQVASKVSGGKITLSPPPTAPAVLGILMIDCTKFDAGQRPSFKMIADRLAGNP